MIDATAARAALADPRTPGGVLAEIAQGYPELRAQVVYHPQAYPGLLDWLAAQGDPRLAATVQAVRAQRPPEAAAPAFPGSGGGPGPVLAAPSAATGPAPGSPVPASPLLRPPMAMPGQPAAYLGYVAAGKSGVQKALDSMTGFEGTAIVRFADLFRDTFKRHNREDMDALMCSGTRAAVYDRRWRLPWLYARVFVVLLSAFLILWLCMIVFSDTSGNVVPGVIFTGALAVPATVMVFFWEFNQARNVSLFDVIRIFFIGGALSILLTFVVSAITDLFQSGAGYGAGAALVTAVFIGFTEELAKAVVVFLLMRKLMGCLISNGLLVGAVVGTGFAVFETMGYATSAWVDGDLEWTLLIRGVLSVGGHVVWAAISGAAVMLAQRPGSVQISARTMDWGKLIALFCVPFVLHTLWDFVSFLVGSILAYALMAALIVIAWVFIVRLINSGLRQYAAMLRQGV